ncbi:MAG: DUF6320 domain-containing protein [Clostridiaceae bacterium]|jgi:predicted nucleic acid-binding Zn ribbon protein|nr:DUF6320 domain-containing protein [Clostridiaceae bacterium]
MFCKECGVNITSPTDHCPLCGTGIGDNTAAERTFPEVKREARFKVRSFSGVYFTALLLCSIAIITAALITAKGLWAIPFVITVTAGYVIIRGIFLGRAHPGTKLFFGVILAAALILSVQNVTKQEWAYSIALPVLLLISSIAMGVLALVATKTSGSYALYMLMTALSGLFPPLFNSLLRHAMMLPSIICATGSGTVLIMVLSCRFKTVIGEIARKLHA